MRCVEEKWYFCLVNIVLNERIEIDVAIWGFDKKMVAVFWLLVWLYADGCRRCRWECKRQSFFWTVRFPSGFEIVYGKPMIACGAVGELRGKLRFWYKKKQDHNRFHCLSAQVSLSVINYFILKFSHRMWIFALISNLSFIVYFYAQSNLLKHFIFRHAMRSPIKYLPATKRKKRLRFEQTNKKKRGKIGQNTQNASIKKTKSCNSKAMQLYLKCRLP